MQRVRSYNSAAERARNLKSFMQKTRSFFRYDFLTEGTLLSLICGLLYLLFVPQFGYFNDDWYLMYAAGARGASVFWDIFAVDRPLRALVMIPAYSWFGPNPLYYNLSAFLFRLISALCFLWTLRMLWPAHRQMTLGMALLFVLYPGFLSQPNAIDYLCHMAGLAAGMLSIGLTIQAVRSTAWRDRFLFYFASILTGWFYLGQIEWYIGLEFFRFACVFLLSFRGGGTLRSRFIHFLKVASPLGLIAGIFLIWRLFFFTSERGATDVDMQFGTIRTQPLTFFYSFLSRLLNDVLDVLIRAWGEPLVRLTNGPGSQQFVTGLVITLLVMLLFQAAYKFALQRDVHDEAAPSSNWKQEMLCIGLGAMMCGLLPVLLVGRTVDFKSFSRYTLIASVGVAMLWPVLISYLPRVWLRNIFLGLLIASASLTQYFNGWAHAQQTQVTRNFWWQVSWRIPQLESGTTLIAHSSVVAEEDYFTWGPANLIYYPQSHHAEYVQPSVYALLLNQETVQKVLADEPQDYSNRRSIRTYPNYNNILILTKPTDYSCLQVIDLNQVELSSMEDPRITAIASNSESEHIMAAESFHMPPEIPFGSEPPHAWCYFYEKAAHARQLGDWEEVARLGRQARLEGFAAQDLIEWMPFLQAYAQLGDLVPLREIAALVTTDPAVTKQVCSILTPMATDATTRAQINQLFCLR